MDIYINGHELPNLGIYEQTYQDWDSPNTDRNAMGELIRERICTKTRLTIGWKWITIDDLSDVLKWTQDVFFTVKYFDIMANKYKTGTFYIGDRQLGVYAYNGELDGCQNVSFNLIEK